MVCDSVVCFSGMVVFFLVLYLMVVEGSVVLK